MQATGKYKFKPPNARDILDLAFPAGASILAEHFEGILIATTATTIEQYRTVMGFFKGASAKVSKKLIACSRTPDVSGQEGIIQPGDIPVNHTPDQPTKNEASSDEKSTSTADTGSTPDQNVYIEHDITVLEWIHSLFPSRNGFLNYLKSLFPCIDWIPRYNWRWLLGDSIAGLTVGLVVVPQAMAYALLAGLTPEFGLYTSFVGAAIYWLFGTSKDIVIGVGSKASIHS